MGGTTGRRTTRPLCGPLLDLAESERPDLIVHAGDLFDAYRPPYSALRLGVQALQRLAAIAPTVVIGGNHDSGALFEVLDEMAAMVASRRLWFVTEPTVLDFLEIAQVPVALACVPFIPPGVIADYATEDPSRFEGSYADGIRKINDELLAESGRRAGPRGIVLYTAHLHVDGARPGNSERHFTVGEDYATHTRGLQRALYCAFGHIHDPQLLPGTTPGRYAGSLIPLDYGERRQSKQAVVVTIRDDVRVDTRELPSGRALASFSGTLAELEARAAGGGLDGCFLKARVISDDPIPDLANALMDWSPGCTIFNLVNEVSNRRARAISESADTSGEPRVDELFAEWRATAARGVKAPDEAVQDLFVHAMGGDDEENGPDFGVADLTVRGKGILDALRPERAKGAG